jgi:hypothetical protein
MYIITSIVMLVVVFLGMVGFIPIIKKLRDQDKLNHLPTMLGEDDGRRHGGSHSKERERGGATTAELQHTTSVLPLTKINTLTDHVDTECAICHEVYKDTDIMRRLPCAHTFHQSCIDVWLEGSRQCALCKHEITSPHAKSPRSSVKRQGKGKGANSWKLKLSLS